METFDDIGKYYFLGFLLFALASLVTLTLYVSTRRPRIETWCVRYQHACGFHQKEIVGWGDTVLCPSCGGHDNAWEHVDALEVKPGKWRIRRDGELLG